jgi:asparagine synthase (glutamine-hydrolysing)
MLREIRFPYLDRDLLEFLYAIPREQIVGLGKRRFLMKRALVGIVPDELLNRRRKAFLLRKPETFSLEWARLIETDQHAVSSSTGFINPREFSAALQESRCNGEVSSLGLMRTVTLERWLRSLTIQGVLTNNMRREGQHYATCTGGKDLQAPARPTSSAC